MSFLEVLWMIFTSSITFYAIVVLTFTLFQIPLRKSHVFTGKGFFEDTIYDVKIIVLVLSMAITNYYTREVLNSPIFLILTVIIFTSLLVLFRRYPLLYAFIVAATGYILSGTIDMLVTLSGVTLGFTNESLLRTDIVHYTVAHIMVALILLILSWVIRKLGINLSLITRRFVGKQAFKRKNFIWMVVLLISLVYMEVTVFGLDTPSLHIWIFIGMVALLVASLIHAYIRNKEHVQARYGAFETSSQSMEQFLKYVEEAKKMNENK
ncbi:hypothetical protein [Paenibacillus sedimenti]|uniref:Uncharacterized protein n=1 Tax=Paenibacillus sedimenti TaxID=2770274 RepID=A0A926QIJ5_9BACL|nr:hypothetical protein [Paenibacillus sedimenti]MBD0379678.1 hypothetical protein [Paenibacillus sedimenti]